MAHHHRRQSTRRRTGLPLATPGVRWRFDPNKNWSALLAVFNGDPGEQGTVNTTGTNFRINDPPLLMGEVQYRRNQGKDDSGLAGITGWAAGIISENSTTTDSARWTLACRRLE